MKVAALQICASSNLEENLKKVELFLKECVEQKVVLCVLPENFALMAVSTRDKLAIQEHQDDGPVQSWLKDMSKKYQLWLVAGSFPIHSSDSSRPFARCLVYNPDGNLTCYYDKIHLFDVEVSSDESYLESNDTAYGNLPVTFNINDFKVGLSICYDLRFPELYRFYQEANVDLILAPSAFTYETGKRHWDILTKARAIENLCYLVAPNQTGVHDNGRKTFGHSQVIDPWGNVLANLQQEEGLAIAELSKKHLLKIRKTFPATKHRKL